MEILSESEQGADEAALGRHVGRGLGWSLLNNAVGRLGNFLAGIIVIRQLTQEEYGVFAVGLVVLSVLLSMNELGVSVAIVQRRGRPESIAPTVMTMSIASSVLLASGAFLAAPGVAALMGTPEAAGLIRLLLVGVVLDGISSVPNAFLTRAFRQRTRLLIDTVAFVVGTPVTIGLALTGHGAWSLGWGAVVGNVTTTVLALFLTPVKVRPGWDRNVVPELLRFGIPLAGASLLSLSILNVDYVIVGHTLGPVELGIYLLAFNLCSWPITVVTSAIRRVGVALFARLAEHATDGGNSAFATCFVLVVGITLPLCILLGGYAYPLIDFLYGDRWVLAANIIAPLAVFSLGRVAVEITYDFLAGTGRTHSTVWLYVAWFLALVPVLTVGAKMNGIRGVAVGHAIVTVVVVGTALLVAFRRAGVPFRAFVVPGLRVILAGVAMVAVIAASHLLPVSPFWTMAVGSPIALAIYFGAASPLRHDALLLWRLRTDGGAVA